MSLREDTLTHVLYFESRNPKTKTNHSLSFFRAIASGLKRPMMKVNVAQILNCLVGQSEKNVDEIFGQAKKKNAVLVFDECEGLFGQRQVDGSRHGKSVVGVLLQNIENFEGICLAITNMREVIDNAFFRRFRFVLEFKMPDVGQRQELWQTMVPKKCPLAPCVSLIDLARRYEMTGGNIKNALVCAATAAALREDTQVVSMKDLVSACDAEVSKKHGTPQAHLRSMYS